VRETQPTSRPVHEVGPLRCCNTCGASYRTDFGRCPLDGGEVVVADSDPLVGATLGGHYVIEALIGVGAMGRVYRAHHVRLLNKRYAVKVLYGELTASATMRMRFAHEAESASKLDHPNVVGVLDFGCTETGLMYLVMDLVGGPTLGALVEQGPLLRARALAFARQLCEGLAHAHERGIVHRDFKPDNILVSGTPGSEVLRIADFGLAISKTDDDDDARLTTSGVMCTPTYAAPEQLLGRDIDHRADLYALGVTLYELLTGGVLPFARGSGDVVVWKMTTEWPAVSSQAKNVDKGLALLVRQLLARDPAARPASANDVIVTLDNLARKPPATPGSSMTMRLTRGPHRVAVACGLGVAAILIASALLTQRSSIASPASTTVSSELAAMAPEPVEREAQLVAPTTVAASTSARVTAPPTPPSTPQEATAKEANAPAETVERAPAPKRAISRAAPVKRPAVAAATRTALRTPARATVATTAPEKPVVAPLAPATAPAGPAITLRPASPEPVTSNPTAAAAPAPTAIAPASQRPSPASKPPKIVGLVINGSLPESVVRRAIERVLPAMKGCAGEVGSRVVHARFGIEETRRAVSVQLGGAGASCIGTQLGAIRTDMAPDIGTVSIDVALSFKNGS
jgi:eukaryotic-like serine/threonine-protein kinase